MGKIGLILLHLSLFTFAYCLTPNRPPSDLAQAAAPKGAAAIRSPNALASLGPTGKAGPGLSASQQGRSLASESSVDLRRVPLTALRSISESRQEVFYKIEEAFDRYRSDINLGDMLAENEHVRDFPLNGQLYPGIGEVAAWKGRFEAYEGDRDFTFEVVIALRRKDSQFDCTSNIYHIEEGEYSYSTHGSCNNSYVRKLKKFHLSFFDEGQSLLGHGSKHAVPNLLLDWPPPSNSEVKGYHVDQLKWLPMGRLHWEKLPNDQLAIYLSEFSR